MVYVRNSLYPHKGLRARQQKFIIKPSSDEIKYYTQDKTRQFLYCDLGYICM